jgi:uncharacterized protein
MSAALDLIYAKIPDAGCKGLCVLSCGPVLCSHTERVEIQKWTGKDIMEWTNIPLDLDNVPPCVFLLDGRCSIYSMRPAVCRMYGSVDHELMRCPHGCKPEKPMTNDDATRILAECDGAT